MKIFLLSQTKNTGWDTFDSMVVIAKSAREARRISPYESHKWSDRLGCWVSKEKPRRHSEWVDDLKDIKVKCVGTTKRKKQGIVCLSFNAG